MKLSLKQTLISLVLTLCVMATGATGWALHSIRVRNDEVAGPTGKQLPASALLVRIEATAATHRIRQFRSMSADTDAVRAGSLDMMRKEEAQLRESMASYEALATAEEKALLDRFKAAWATNEAAWSEVLRRNRAVGHDEALRHFRGEGLRI